MNFCFSFVFCHPFLFKKSNIKVVFKQNKLTNDKFGHLTQISSNDRLNIDNTTNELSSLLDDDKQQAATVNNANETTTATSCKRQTALYYRVHYYLNSTIGIVS